MHTMALIDTELICLEYTLIELRNNLHISIETLYLVEVDSSSLRRTPQDGAGLVRLPGFSWVDLFVWIAYM